MSAESDLQRYRSEANRLRSDVSKASSTVAAQRKKATDATAAAGRSKSAATIRSKNSEADRASKAANGAEKKRASLEKKLADAEVKIARTQAKVDKERQTAQRRAMDDLRRTTENASFQFRPQPGADVPRPAARPEAAREPAKEVFLSHASEDKDEIARPLKEALESRGISVWFDEIQIQVGQSIRQRIEHGIANCRFGVVVVSPHFFAKQWTNAELDALFSKKMDSGESMVLPVWHHVSKDEVMHQSPLLSGILALNSATMTVDEMADALTAVVRP